MTAVATTAPSIDSQVVTLTPAQAEVLDRCPFQYRARYVQRLVPETRQRTPHLAMGDSVHACLYHFHKRGGHQHYAGPAMAALLDESWRHDGYADAAQEAAFRARAAAMCEAYHEGSRAEAVRHLGHEVFLSATFRLAGIQLRVRGKLDRLSLWPDGHLEVVDYKTGAEPPGQADLADALAPFLYLLLARRAYPDYDRVDVSHLYLGTMARVTIVYDRQRCLAGKDRLAQAVTQIAHGVFPPSPHAFCPACPVRHHCPAMREDEIDLDTLL